MDVQKTKEYIVMQLISMNDRGHYYIIQNLPENYFMSFQELYKYIL